jgi:hypothetical protein
MRIAREHYRDLEGMFAAHEWDAGGRVISQIAPTLVVDTYGGVESFVRAHPAIVPNAFDIVNEAAPDVWLTSFYGFAPRNWGFLGFTVPWMRDRFIRESRPGALMLVYGASGAAPDERGKLLGIQQMSHEIGSAQNFMEPDAWAAKQANPDRRDKWNLGVRAVRAWKVTPETRSLISDFASETFTRGRSQTIGAQGMRLTANEARKILTLDLQEVAVFGGPSVDHCVAGPAAEILRPSKAGPVSTTGSWHRESEGPKHLYILKLDGNGDHFMGEAIGDNLVVKVGMSRSPDTRCDDHNRALPKCAFEWKIACSTFVDGRGPFPNSRLALIGEQAMKDFLEREGRSLGGEFFLASRSQMDLAWRRGVDAASGSTAT